MIFKMGIMRNQYNESNKIALLDNIKIVLLHIITLILHYDLETKYIFRYDRRIKTKSSSSITMQRRQRIHIASAATLWTTSALAITHLGALQHLQSSYTAGLDACVAEDVDWDVSPSTHLKKPHPPSSYK
jgi:hypothetical protein